MGDGYVRTYACMYEFYSSTRWLPSVQLVYDAIAVHKDRARYAGHNILPRLPYAEAVFLVSAYPTLATQLQVLLSRRVQQRFAFPLYHTQMDLKARVTRFTLACRLRRF